MTRIAIVLGGGGITGIAWLLGALEVIEEQTGWDPASADVVCGTSAGAIAAAVLAGGSPTEELLALAERPELLAERIEEATGKPAERRRIPMAWPGSLALGLTGLAAVNPRRRLTSLIGFVPSGSASTGEIRGLVHDAALAGWPTTPKLLINACDYRTGRRVTFGADGAPEASLSDAVAASAAVPGWYRPVQIGGRAYVDGGLISFTNADVVAPEQPDVVLCLSPFSSTETGGSRDGAIFGALRRGAHRRLEQELTRLRAGGAEVAAIEPTHEDLRCMGLNVMERGHARAVVETARTTTRARLDELLSGIELPAPTTAAPRLRLVA